MRNLNPKKRRNNAKCVGVNRSDAGISLLAIFLIKTSFMPVLEVMPGGMDILLCSKIAYELMLSVDILWRSGPWTGITL